MKCASFENNFTMIRYIIKLEHLFLISMKRPLYTMHLMVGDPVGIVVAGQISNASTTIPPECRQLYVCVILASIHQTNII